MELPILFTSLVIGGYVFGGIFLSVCMQHYHANSYERIAMKSCGGVQGGTMIKF